MTPIQCSIVLLAALTGCVDPDYDRANPTTGRDTADDTNTTQVDADLDGFIASEDCDDTRSDINPDAAENCDGVDNNCNGVVDDNSGLVYFDSDGDGFGNASDSIDTCAGSIGHYVADSTDCDDTTAAVNPAAVEVCNTVDDDCDLAIDEAVTTIYYVDTDGDGQGSASTSTEACAMPIGYVDNASDCDDANAAAFDGATELCNGFDDDCDSVTDETDAADATTWFHDGDGDGYGDVSLTYVACVMPRFTYSADATDCDDTNAAVNPGADEVCDGSTDENCDGTVDESTAIDASTWYADLDSDRFGDAANSIVSCDAPAGFIADSADCDDLDVDINPVEIEVCNGVDDDCDGAIDPSTSADASTWYADLDADSYGDLATSQNACSQPVDYVVDTTDCKPYDPSINPGEVEVCNGVDDNCDGSVDEGVVPTWYEDADSDGEGNASSSTDTCSAPAGYVSVAGDCDDADAAVNTTATEACNEIDDNCDGATDEGVETTYFADVDADSYGDASSTDDACAAPTGYVSDATDCDDADHSVHPSAAEYANLVDDDCDGTVDEGTSFDDIDGDGYTGVDDCDDSNADVYPGAIESCDGVDNNCDGDIDEDTAVDADDWYSDADGDGYGEDGTGFTACDGPAGYVNVAGDCDDEDPAFNPGASDICSDPTDYNCDGSIGYADVDGDGTPACEDCDDTESDAYPGADEVCDGIDNDCDGSTDPSTSLDALVWYADSDADTFGDATVSQLACDLPAGYVIDSTDCDDNEWTTNPDATEVVNGLDDDCDGAVDDGTTADDSDGDGYSFDAGDCADDDATRFPGAVELCNGVDDDCDEDTDESSAADATEWFPDDDSDGYGDSAVSVTLCDQPSGFVGNDDDCDDHDAAFNPGATEVCTDPTDYNCDGSVAYVDVDGDGAAACLDCDDTESDAYPGAVEVCDGIDNDCDGSTDPSTSLDATTWYEDGDNDTYGSMIVSEVACDQPSGYVADNTDCDDNQRTTYPGAIEYCNSLDDDCDGASDESGASGAPSWYVDADLDGYGDASASAASCTVPSGYVADATDCDDSADIVNPDAVEACASLDLDCDGTTGFGGDTDANCDVPLDCVANGDGTVTATFTIPSASTTAWQGTITPAEINLYLWDVGSVTSAAYAGDGTAHSQTFATSSFTPEAEDASGAVQWANVNAWYVTSSCSALYQVEIDAAGTDLYFDYVGP